MNKKAEILDLFENVKNLKGEIISTEGEILSKPTKMVFRDPFIVYYSSKEPELFKVFDVQKGHIVARFGKRGRGPQEFLSVTNMSLDESGRDVDFYDFSKKTFNRLHLNCEFLQKSRFDKLFDGDGDMLDVISVRGDSSFFASGLFRNCRFVLGNKGQIISTFNKFPEIPEHVVMDTMMLNLGYHNVFAISPDRTRIANIVYTSEILEVFKITDCEIEKLWGHELSMGSFKPKGNGNGTYVKHSDDGFGYKAVTATVDRIYCLYSKCKYSEDRHRAASGTYVMVFDWDGHLENTYHLDYPLRTFAVSNQGGLLFGSTLLDNDFKIVKYSLK